MFIMFIVVVVSQVYICQDFSSCIHYGHMQFIVYQLHLEAIKKNFNVKTLTFLHISVQSVASIGNTLNSVHLAVEAIQKTVDEHKKTMELLQSDSVRESTDGVKSQSSPAHHRYYCAPL